MTIESVTYITDLDDTNPGAGDSRVEGDDHIRNIKTGILGTFASFTGIPVTVTEAQVNHLDINILGTAEPSMAVTTDANTMVKNLLLDEATTFFSDASDTTKQVKFETSNATTATVTTIEARQSTNRTITLPNATDTLIGKDTTDTLTNKTLTDAVLNGDVGGTALNTDLSVTAETTKVPTAAAAKAYVDDYTISASSKSDTLTISGLANGSKSVAHALGASPDNVEWYLRCDTGHDNWAAGDRIFELSGRTATSVTEALTVMADATNVKVNIDQEVRAMDDTGSLSALTLANWSFVCKATIWS